MRDWIDVAVLAKCKNNEGRFVVHGTAGLPFVLQEGDSVAFVPPRTDLPRNAVVSHVRLLDDNRADVRFEGIAGDDARAMAGMHCLIRRDEIDEEMFEDSPGMWDGWTVLDEEAGEIGAVSGLVENPAHPLLEVEVPGREEPLLIPVVDEIVKSVDVEEALVHVALPKGLLDL